MVIKKKNFLLVITVKILRIFPATIFINHIYMIRKISCPGYLIPFKAIYYLLFLQLFINNNHCSAQSQIKKEAFNALNVTYFGKSVTRPGIKAGTNIFDYDLRWHIKPDGDTTTRRFIISSNIGFYCHFRNHYGLFLNSEFGYRTTYSNRFFWQCDIGAGYLRTFLAGRVYKVINDGEIHQVFLAGSNQFMPGIGITLGKDFTCRNKKLKSLYGRFGGFLQYPYNTMWLPSLNIEIGASFNLK